MLSRRTRAFFACLSTGLLLFVQAVAVAHACFAPEAAPAMAFAEGMAGQDCHDAVPADPQPNPNACLQHCNAGDQTTAQVPVALPAMPALAVLTLPLPVETVPVFARTAACELHSPDPPQSLRFCSFQL